MFGEKPKAFLALPLKDTAELANEIAEALQKQGIEPVQATDVGMGGTFTDQIQEAIHKAEYVVADLTGTSPHVLFEVGMALGLRKPVLLLSQEAMKDVPFDLHVHQVAMYRREDLSAVRRYVELWLREVQERRETAAS